MKNDDFGDRMKGYEAIETDRRLPNNLPIYARLDGRGFSKFTKGMNRPYDTVMSYAMIEVTKQLVLRTGAVMGYTQSDEISLAWPALNGGTQRMFDGKILKLTSILSGMATAVFMREMIESEYQGKIYELPHFDCRIMSMPSNSEVANAFLWREQDATKNAITMAASRYFSHKELQGVDGSNKIEMLRKGGIRFDGYPSFFTRGTFLQRREVVEYVVEDTDLSHIPEAHRPAIGIPIVRHKVDAVDMPKFGLISNRADVIFHGAKPELFAHAG